jgi:hypothetical protein
MLKTSVITTSETVPQTKIDAVLHAIAVLGYQAGEDEILAYVQQHFPHVLRAADETSLVEASRTPAPTPTPAETPLVMQSTTQVEELPLENVESDKHKHKPKPRKK